MNPATLCLTLLAALAGLCTGAGPVPRPLRMPLPGLAASGLPEEKYLIIIGAIVLIAGGALGGLHNLLKVLEYFRLKRQGEAAGHNSGLVSRHTLDEELNRVYERIEERDKRLETKIDHLAATSGKLAENVASALTAIRFISDAAAKKGGPRA